MKNICGRLTYIKILCVLCCSVNSIPNVSHQNQYNSIEVINTARCLKCIHLIYVYVCIKLAGITFPGHGLAWSAFWSCVRIDFGIEN